MSLGGASDSYLTTVLAVTVFDFEDIVSVVAVTVWCVVEGI